MTVRELRLVLIAVGCIMTIALAPREPLGRTAPRPAAAPAAPNCPALPPVELRAGSRWT